MNKAEAVRIVKIINTLIELSKVSKILNTFYKAFSEGSLLKADGMLYLHGSLKLGGTVSGRLSHAQPNMGNIPSSGTPHAKNVKTNFKAPPGWLFVGADFNSLEDMISALTTRDPAKMKVYIDGYDGHCLRALAYFPDLMPQVVSELDLKEDDRVFEITNDDGSLIYAKGSDILQPSGKTVLELFDEINS